MPDPHRAAAPPRPDHAADIAASPHPRRRTRWPVLLIGGGLFVMLAALGLAAHRATAQTPASVTVRAGDTLSDIAARYYGDADEAGRIAAYNRIADPDRIVAGAELLLPPRGLAPSVATTAAVARHTVQPGESLSTIAERFYGSTAFARPLAVANDLADPDLVIIGQPLILPSSVSTAAGSTASPRAAPAAPGPVAPPASAAAAASGALAGRRVCVDPGHGGTDPGAVYAFETGRLLREAEVALDISLALAQRLRGQGAQVTLTRTSDITLDLPDRAAICNTARADVTVSVHLNGVDDRSIDGSLALWGKPGERLLAEVMAGALQSGLFGGPGANATAFGARNFPGRVLLYTSMPAVIVEPAFITNPLEARGLLAPTSDPAGRRAQITREIERGLVAYLR